MGENFFKLSHGKLNCRKCNKVIQAGDLQIDYGYKGNHCHFQCSLDTCSFDDCQKADIQIFIRSNFDETLEETLLTLVSLEVYDQNPDDYQLSISEEDLTKIREQIALAKEHKTKFFIPSVSKVSRVSCHQKCHTTSNHNTPAEQLQLRFQRETYHPLCLLETGKINLDAKKFLGYNTLAENQRQYLNKLFKKDQPAYYFPTAQRKSAHLEYCSFSKCLRSRTNPLINGLRILYKTKSYHPVCFAAMGKVNIDGEKIGNFNSLTYNQKEFFVNNFKNSDGFDIPFIEYAKSGGYCTKCLQADGPSQFPWPYTITKNQLQIKFHGNFYHPKCFQSTNKVNLAAKDFYGYNALTEKEKQALDEIFVQNDVVFDGAVDGDDGGDLGQQDESEHGNDEQKIKAQTEVKQEESENGQEHTVSPNNEMQSATVKSDDQNENMVTALSEDIEMQEFDYDVVAIDGTQNHLSERQPPSAADFGNGKEIDGRLDGNDLKRNAEDAIVNIDTDDDDDDVFVIEPPPAKKIKLESKTEVKMEANDQLNNEEPTGNITLFKYETPNDAFVKSVLEKLHFPINKQALLFWINVSYTVFTATSTPTSTFDISSDNSFFKSLSCFFTGKEEKYLWIKRAIQAYFFNNFKTFGTIDGIDFSNLDTTSNQFDEFYECTQLSNIHFTFICSWLKCRIGIFSSGQNGLQKYGNWEEEEGHPILLIQNENGYYKPVLTLI